MKVILQRDIPKVGKHGDVVTVKDGYARNYLFPRHLAVSASGGALKAHQARAAQEKEKGAKQLGEAQSQAERLQGLTLYVIGKVGTGTKLYGSITAQDIADAIATEKNVTIDKRRVGLVDPIKTLGTYRVPVRLHSDVTIPVRVEVVTEEQVEIRRKQVEVEEAEALETARLAAETAASEKAAADAAAAEAAAQAKLEAPTPSPEAPEESLAESDTIEAADQAAEDSAASSESEE